MSICPQATLLFALLPALLRATDYRVPHHANRVPFNPSQDEWVNPNK